MIKKISHFFTLNNGVLAVSLLLAVSWLWSTVEAIQKNFILQQRVDTLKQEIAFQEVENQTLEFQKLYFRSHEYLELSARRRLNKAGEGEKVVILPAHKTRTTKEELGAPERVMPITQRSNFEQWWYFLFGKKRID